MKRLREKAGTLPARALVRFVRSVQARLDALAASVREALESAGFADVTVSFGFDGGEAVGRAWFTAPTDDAIHAVVARVEAATGLMVPTAYPRGMSKVCVDLRLPKEIVVDGRSPPMEAKR